MKGNITFAKIIKTLSKRFILLKTMKKLILKLLNCFKKREKNPVLDYLIETSRYSTSPFEKVEFTREERLFFKSLIDLCIANSLNPYEIQLTRLSDKTFNVYTNDGYIGKINLYTFPDKYTVVKQGGKKAIRIFNSKRRAERFIKENNNESIWEIKIKKGKRKFHMQYLIGMYSIKHVHEPTLEECISLLPFWIKHMKYCKRF